MDTCAKVAALVVVIQQWLAIFQRKGHVLAELEGRDGDVHIKCARCDEAWATNAYGVNFRLFDSMPGCAAVAAPPTSPGN